MRWALYPCPRKHALAPATDAAQLRKTGRRLEQVVKLGRGHPLQLVLGMDAEFFVIMPAATGWDVFHGMQGQGWFATWCDAVVAADLMAEARRDDAGVTTAVVVELKSRDSAVVSLYAKRACAG